MLQTYKLPIKTKQLFTENCLLEVNEQVKLQKKNPDIDFPHGYTFRSTYRLIIHFTATRLNIAFIVHICIKDLLHVPTPELDE